MATWTANVTNVDGSVSLYNLSDRNPFKVLSATGIGNAEVRRLEERGPFQEGVTDTGYRVDPRIITLIIQIYGSSASDADVQRDKLSSIFSPIADAPVRLLLTRDDGSQRQIDCYSVGMVDLPAEFPTRVLNSQRVAVQLKAPNPFFYDPIIKTSTLTITPFVIDWWLGNGLIGTANVLYKDTGISLGSAVSLGSADYNEKRTIFFYSQRPSSPGTVVPWDYRWTPDPLWNQSRIAFAARISSDQAHLRGSADALSFALFNYGTAAGSAVATILQTDNSSVVKQINNGGTITTLSGGFGVSSRGAGTLTWRQNTSSGSAWGNAMSHAAIYDIALSDAQLHAIVERIVEGSVPTQAFIGTINYTGNWSEYPVIAIRGPIDNPVIENTATGETISFSGTISDTTVWSIDTRYGYKTVTTQGGSSVIDKLSDDSDLATFHFQPGVNPIRVSTTGGTTTATQIDISYYNRYLSS